MKNLDKYKIVIPAFYACYGDDGEISPERIHQLVQFYIDKGIKGLYVGGSSGECIYQTLDERKLVLEEVMKVAKDKLVIIAHIGAPNTKNSVLLAEHAKSCGATAMATATDLDFFIYNIPQLTNYNLSIPVYQELLKLPQVVGVKNSSMPVLDIMTKKMHATKEVIIFNGPDEQYIGGRMMGADGGIGGTYGVMPELYLKLEELFVKGEVQKAQELQMELNVIITKLCSFSAHMYSVIKAILKLKGINVGTGRPPLRSVDVTDMDKLKEVAKYIDVAINKYCS